MLSKRKTISESFAQTARRIWASAMLTTALSGTMLAQQSSGLLADPQTTSKKNMAINEDLVLNAQQDFRMLAQLPATAYSKKLDSLSSALNATAQPLGLKVSVIDPYVFDVGVGVGLRIEDVVAEIVDMKGLQHDLRWVEMLYPSIYNRVAMPGNKTYFTQKPETHGMRDIGFNGPDRVLIPISDNLPLQGAIIPGLSIAETIELVTFHEAAHTTDDYFSFDGIDGKKLVRFDYSDPQQVEKNEDGFKYMNIVYKREALADVTALSQMIRRGKNPDIIDKIIAMRDAEGEAAFTHLSSPVLDGLKKEIDKMGLDSFRKMDEKSARDFYFKCVETYAVDYQGLRVALRYHQAKTPDICEKYDRLSATDPAILKAVNLAKHIKKKTPAQEMAAHGYRFYTTNDPEVLNWNPLPELVDRAFKNAKVVTPKTVIVAYGDIMDELAEQRRKSPDKEKDITIKMARLKDCFTRTLSLIDYASINSDRGVALKDIRKHDMAYKP